VTLTASAGWTQAWLSSPKATPYHWSTGRPPSPAAWPGGWPGGWAGPRKSSLSLRAVAPVFVADQRAPRRLGGPVALPRLVLAETRQVGDMAVLKYLLSAQSRAQPGSESGLLRE
jgi:hypothetical protein